MPAPRGNKNRKGKKTGEGIAITLSLTHTEYEIWQAILGYEGTEITPEKCRERIRWTAKKAIRAEERKYFETLLLNEKLEK